MIIIKKKSTESNFAPWQKNSVDARESKLISILKDMKELKTPSMKVTALARLIADRMQRDQMSVNSSSEPYAAVDETTLLRKNGKYRPLIDAYILERDGLDSYAYVNADPIASRVLESYKIRLKQSGLVIERLKSKLVKLEAASNRLQKINNTSLHKVSLDSQVDAMGKVASIFFEMLLSTDYCKFDEATGDILAVARSRKILISASDIAVYLNWRYRAS
ncbi:hypothetical protein [Pseudomonas abietaniphila]|uniref:hypothetical protein n=1 Tax=Pseudomonas abietaniphila TaxID=89065 RepID=UPI0007857FB1|nr:hypothetical protein [Pseudomonas abietaniphila]